MANESSVVLYIPEAGIYPYLRSLAVLGDAAIKQGKKVYITRCTGQLNRCVVMDMHHLPAQVSKEKKEEICKKCSENISEVQKHYSFSVIELADFIDSITIQEIDKLVNTANDSEELTYNGFRVGKVAQFDFTLATKYLYNRNLSQDYQEIYKNYIRTISLAVSITDRICKQFKPSLLLTFGEYGHYQGARYATIMNKISRMAVVHPMHLNCDYSQFIIWKNTNEAFFYPHCQKWPKYNDIPIRPYHVKECWDDVFYRLFNKGSSHIFSSKKQTDPCIIFEKLKLNSKKKLAVAYSCSYDERQVKDVVMDVWKEGPQIIDAFPTQIDWLLMLREYVKQRDDLQIVVRIHPREGNRQFGFSSQHLKQLKEAFTENSINFTIIWADDPISSYDLMELADICLVPWSLMGQEAARLGIPVLSCTANMFYADDDFIQVAKNPVEYKNRLDSMLEMKNTLQHLVKAIRYNNWRTFVPALDLRKTVPADYSDDRIWPKAPTNMIKVINDILEGKEDLITYNINQWKGMLSEHSKNEEIAAVLRGIRQFLDAIFYPPKSQTGPGFWFKVRRKFWQVLTGKRITFNAMSSAFKDYTLKYSCDTKKINDYIKETQKNQNTRIIVADGAYAILIHRGKLLRRMSPMIVRLAELHDSGSEKIKCF